MLEYPQVKVLKEVSRHDSEEIFCLGSIFYIRGHRALFSFTRATIPDWRKIGCWKIDHLVVVFRLLAYSLYCSAKENIFKTVKRIYPFYWALQIGLGLYLGLVISLFIIYLNEGSFLIMALWSIPVLLFANLATLLYFAMNFDSIFSMFLTS